MRLRSAAAYGALAAALGVACGGRADLGSLAGPVQGEARAAHDAGSTLDASVTVDATALADASCANASASPGDDGPNDSSTCAIVVASQYDQCCTVDSDCVAVGEVASCQGVCVNCPAGAINKGAEARYNAAFERAIPLGSGGTCPCPQESGAVCRNGRCQMATGVPSGDTLPSCADAGGWCVYSVSITCGVAGPPGSCARSDEVCCLP